MSSTKSALALERLPFVGPRKNPRRGETPRSFWLNVVSTGDIEKDQELGSQYAYLALQAIKADDFAPLLGWIVLDMMKYNCPEHIVVGFFQSVTDMCLGHYEIPSADVHLKSAKHPALQ